MAQAKLSPHEIELHMPSYPFTVENMNNKYGPSKVFTIDN
jgi:hypothetical protein